MPRYQIVVPQLALQTNFYWSPGEYGTGRAVYPYGAFLPGDIPASVAAGYVAAGKVVDEGPFEGWRLRVVSGPVTLTSWLYSDWTWDGIRKGTRTCQTGDLIPGDAPRAEVQAIGNKLALIDPIL